MDDRGLQIAEDVARTYGAQLVAMDAATVVEAGPEPSTIAIGSLAQTCNEELIEALRDCGRVVFQE